MMQQKGGGIMGKPYNRQHRRLLLALIALVLALGLLGRLFGA